MPIVTLLIIAYAIIGSVTISSVAYRLTIPRRIALPAFSACNPPDWRV